MIVCDRTSAIFFVEHKHRMKCASNLMETSVFDRDSYLMHEREKIVSLHTLSVSNGQCSGRVGYMLAEVSL